MAQPPMRSEYTPGSPPPIPVPAGTPMPPGRRLRVTLAIVGGMVLLLCMGSVGMAYALYDNATAPDRSAPDVAVDNYLRASLIDENKTTSDLFVCKEPASLDLVADLQREMKDREARFGVNVTVTWGSLARSAQTKAHESVAVDVTIAGFANGAIQSRRSEQWVFDVVDERGWRVCGVERVG